MVAVSTASDEPAAFTNGVDALALERRERRGGGVRPCLYASERRTLVSHCKLCTER